MNRKLTDNQELTASFTEEPVRFFTETVEVGPLSPLAFFEASPSLYRDQRFFWQNADKTLTLVGVGRAAALESEDADGRFQSISTQWKTLCASLIKEEKDMNPVLFGGFSFDAKSMQEQEWSQFAAAHFIVPTFQLKVQNGKTLIAINYITSEPHAAEAFEGLRQERDRLIHMAQVEAVHVPERPRLLAQEEIEKERYLHAVKQVTSQIKEGKAEKVVIARKLKLTFDQVFEGATALQAISNEQQASYHFGMQLGDNMFFGATPERLVEVANGRVYSACVAGSIRRGASASEDRLLGDQLLRDRKNREEHQYVVDMISDVFHTYCKAVQIKQTPKLMKIRDIQHLFTPVEGTLAKDVDIFQLVEALHPTPALGGMPGQVALEMIREEEGMDRGYYAGPLGWTDSAGNGEFAVAIRSALLKGKNAYLYAGGGIVADSQPAEEYAETWVKFRPVIRALGGKLHD